MRAWNTILEGSMVSLDCLCACTLFPPSVSSRRATKQRTWPPPPGHDLTGHSITQRRGPESKPNHQRSSDQPVNVSGTGRDGRSHECNRAQPHHQQLSRAKYVRNRRQQRAERRLHECDGVGDPVLPFGVWECGADVVELGGKGDVSLGLLYQYCCYCYYYLLLPHVGTVPYVVFFPQHSVRRRMCVCHLRTTVGGPTKASKVTYCRMHMAANASHVLACSSGSSSSAKF
jgi:hypothetical protein